MGIVPDSVRKYLDEDLPILSDQVKTMETLHSLAWRLDKDMKDKQAAASGNTAKVTPAYDKAAATDSKAKAEARKLVNAYLAAVEKATTANPNVAYWLADIGKAISQFTTSEVNFYRWQTDKASDTPKVNAPSGVAEINSDRKDTVTLAKKLLGLFDDSIIADLSAIDASHSEDKGYRPLVDKGKVNLPNIQGRTGDSDSPAGKFASLSFMVFTVNEETFPVGTDSRVVLRSIFSGADRIGKRPGDLYDAMVKANNGNTPKVAGETVEFKLNGKNVKAVRTSLTADELPELANYDEESEDSDS